MTILKTALAACCALALGTGAATAWESAPHPHHHHGDPAKIGPYTYTRYAPTVVVCPKHTTVARDHGVLYCVPNTQFEHAVSPIHHHH
ncbi:hypothetical protein [Tropicibacter alexandrii]|uniref:hypothetical protein n=1 Tax=Tropicibacter alexandrii TaxID=2267683 RepID=UPI000EF5236A|nr:hypothetical protein [Tropicibacter alexandrii]